MKKKLFVLLVFSTLMTIKTNAQWSANSAINTAISVVGDDQRVPNIVSDDAGGVIIAWNDRRNGNDYDIYAQRINAAGVVQWTANGVAVCTSTNDQVTVKIVSDGANGAIISWQDFRNGSDYDIYAQRINSLGVVQWTANGVAVCTATNDQYFSKYQNRSVVSDGANGAIITWQDIRNGSNFDVYAQRIDGAGAIQWATNGLAICTMANDQDLPIIISDASSGAIITWQDFRNGSDYDTYVQRINSAGVVQWTANGVAICTAVDGQYEPAIVLSGSGGAIISWADYRSGVNNDIYAQQVNSSGVVQWAANGVVICGAADEQNTVFIDSDGANGAIITWSDLRSGSTNDVYAQRINSTGAVQWTANGVVISATTNDQNVPVIISNGTGGAIITWNDYRNGNDIDIYAQQINGAGAVQWTANGVAIATSVDDNDVPVIVSDGSGGAIISWSDYRNGNDIDVYAQNICSAGILGGAPSAPAAISGVTTICSGTSNSYSIVPVAGASSYSWTVPSGWTGTSTTNSIAVTAGINSGTITVVAINACGTSTISSKTITVTPLPALPVGIVGTTIICSGSSNIYSVVPITGATSYSWIAPSGWIGSSTSNSISVTANAVSGTMSVTAINVCGVSPTVSQTITVNPLPNVTTTLVSGVTIASNQNGASYQWLNCASGNPITNATNQNYTATSNGSFAVVVTLNGCLGTSSCVTISSIVGIAELSGDNQLAIYPNPSNGVFFIQSFNEGVYTIINELRQTIKSFELNAANKYTLHIENLANGIYFIVGFNNNKTTSQKIMVTK
jgi:hypothetical protein